MLDKLLAITAEKKLYRLVWFARGHNADAQKLYEKITPGEDYKRYKAIARAI